MNKLALCIASTFFVSTVVVPTAAVAAEGVISVESGYSVALTVDRLEGILKKKGMTVFARIDHTAGATKAGLKLRPTVVVLFGNPKVGTPLMHCGQTVAIDLPQKALVHEDDAGRVWLSYNDPKHLAQRHGAKGCEEVLQKIENALGAISAKATTRPPQGKKR
jgi:uncharacterized protein (DUF302 family)